MGIRRMIELKKEIEIAIKTGKLAHLVQYIKGERGKTNKPNQDMEKVYVDTIKRGRENHLPDSRVVRSTAEGLD
jgi:hypothetical protein